MISNKYSQEHQDVVLVIEDDDDNRQTRNKKQVPLTKFS